MKFKKKQQQTNIVDWVIVGIKWIIIQILLLYIIVIIPFVDRILFSREWGPPPY